MSVTVSNRRVAVLGLGVSGLTAVKNMIEQGFDATGFERNEYVGGLWQFNPDPKQTTALKVTRTNATKQFSAYQDFEFPADVPDFPTADQVCEYMRAYASRFSLEKHFRFGVTIDKIERASSSGPVQWAIKMRDEEGEKTEVFDRVVVTTGPFGKPFVPKIKDVEVFEGDILHSRAYKGPDPFVGKRVAVVGLGNTGCDIATELCGAAKQVYLSHRAGGRVMRRYNEGKPLDHTVTRRRVVLGNMLNKAAPRLAAFLSSYIMDKMFYSRNPGYKKEWKLVPAPPITHAPGAMNEHLMDRLIDGTVINLSGITRFTPTGIVTDEGEINVDVVIFATGAYFDYSILSDEANPTKFPTPEWEKSHHNNDLDFPRLYQTLFSTHFPNSLAFIGPCRGFSFAAFSNSDLASQAIGQIWSGKYPVPTSLEMEKWCDANYDRALTQIKTWRIPKTGADPVAFERWLNQAVGNGVNEAFGWGWEGWKFWWKERELYKLLIDGINTPFVYRLFEGREGSRRRWEGAKDAIYRANGLSSR